MTVNSKSPVKISCQSASLSSLIQDTPRISPHVSNNGLVNLLQESDVLVEHSSHHPVPETGRCVSIGSRKLDIADDGG